MLDAGYADHVIPPQEIPRLLGAGYLQTAAPDECNLEASTGGIEYIICAGQKWAVPPLVQQYARSHLLGSAPHRLLWEAALNSYPAVDTLAGCPNSDTEQFGKTYSDIQERYMGTNAADSCSNTSAQNDEPVDAWGPDFNDDRWVNQSDLGVLGDPSRYNKWLPDPAYDRRYDLALNGRVELSDMGFFGTAYNKQCTN